MIGSVKASFAFKGPNCSQRTLLAFKDKLNLSDEYIDSFKDKGTGHAPDNFCGALYAALSLVKDPINKQKLMAEYRAIAGDIQCKKIRKLDIIPCPVCVETGIKLTEKYL